LVTSSGWGCISVLGKRGIIRREKEAR